MDNPYPGQETYLFVSISSEKTYTAGLDLIQLRKQYRTTVCCVIFLR